MFKILLPSWDGNRYQKSGRYSNAWHKGNRLYNERRPSLRYVDPLRMRERRWRTFSTLARRMDIPSQSLFATADKLIETLDGIAEPGTVARIP
jgi:hypothetical protein